MTPNAKELYRQYRRGARCARRYKHRTAYALRAFTFCLDAIPPGTAAELSFFSGWNDSQDELARRSMATARQKGAIA